MMGYKRKIPTNERINSGYGKTWSSYRLGSKVDTDIALSIFVNKNKSKLKRMNKNEAISLMKRNCISDTSDIKSYYISKRDLDKIIDNN